MTKEMIKTACVYKDKTGYWVAWADDTKEKLGGLHDTELQAHKEANARGYLVR
jgi:hypothetical protein